MKNYIFEHNNEKYIIKLKTKENKNPHILKLSNNRRLDNQKEVLRRVLAQNNFDIPTHSMFNTHMSVNLLYKVLNNLPLTEKEMSIKNQ